MEIGPELVEGQFVERTNRFLARVIVAGRDVGVHVPNSGRMLELFTPGARVLLRPVNGNLKSNHRKTCYDLALVDLDGTLVSADARLPNALVAESITGGQIPQLSGYSELVREAGFGESRLDIMLNGAQGRCYVEAKSVTLIENGVGLFPDSPTVRGAKHLQSLAQAVEHGHRAAVVFVVQRPDAAAFSTNDPADPVLADAFRNACAAGVEAYAYTCQVTEQFVRLDRSLPIVPYPGVWL